METWKSVDMEQFRGLYEISNFGKVRVKPYKFFKNGELQQSKPKVLEVYDKQVFLTNGSYRQLWSIGVLYNATYKE